MNDRKQRGASIALVVTLLFVLAVLVVGIVSLINLLGGGQQMQRATDAGNLSLVRSALTKVSVPLAMTGNEVQFNGCSDPQAATNGNVNLRNINKLSGQTLLVNLNAAKISSDGLDQGATAHAGALNTTLSGVCTALSNKLQQPGSVNGFFQNIAQLNPTQQFSTQNIAASGTPKPSYMERGTASNVYINAKQFPDYNPSAGTSAFYNATAHNWVTNVNSDPGKAYLKGYQDGFTPNAAFSATHFVPLMPGARPHLVPQAEFQSNTNPAVGLNTFNWANPVPNALSISSTSSTKHGYPGNFAAFALVAPIDPVGYPISIPRGFIRINNGAASPASGFAGGGNDAFVQVMEHPASYCSAGGTPLPYFISEGDSGLGSNSPAQYIQNIIDANNNGTAPDCSALRVGYALSGDHIGMGGVSAANCATINGTGGGSGFNNIDLDNPTSVANSDMHAYNTSDSRHLWARPLIEQAYNIPPPTPTGSNNANVNVADIFNLDLLSARATGDDFHPTNTANSGIAHIPTTARSPLTSPNFRITSDQGVWLQSTSGEGIPHGGKIWNFLINRLNQIDPTWNQNLNAVLSQNFVPMGGRAYIYYSTNANGGAGGLVLKEESQAFADAPWLNTFATQAADAKRPQNPTDMRQVKLEPFDMVDVPEDWGYPVPYDYPGDVCVINWYSFTPSSGWNNLLGELNMGATTDNCCPLGAANPTSSFTIVPSGATNTLSIPGGCGCVSGGGCDYTGPC